ncbi:hypothetical protein [Flavobacterium johnsoniae]|uniref:Uncharacterized protein n=1 Tax=Flavobacterium johnsoniae TaxID=986 RepID=A0A1J7BRL6_FLAJO|nr:hypothetical protein [Flavobacterium johnsoniae]OIV41347.1 hypothetical protein BKM63_12445 [Flavobacterium johnsoniae]
MSQLAVLNHIEKILNYMGNNINIIATGNFTNSENGDISIEIKPIKISSSFNEFLLPTPKPQNKIDIDTNTYSINRVRISTSIIDDYSKKYPYSNNDILEIILHKEFLFGWY